MLRTLLKSKIHRGRITEANLDYEGSLTIDGDLMDAVGLIEFEQIHVWNVTRGTRLVTYAMRGLADSGVLCLNGAAAHRGQVGDVIIIASFASFSDSETLDHRPRIVLLDHRNRVKSLVDREVPGPEVRPESC